MCAVGEGCSHGYSGAQVGGVQSRCCAVWSCCLVIVAVALPCRALITRCRVIVAAVFSPQVYYVL